MTHILSLSINDELAKDLDEKQKELQFSGRSELMRTALRSFLSRQEKLEHQDGSMEALILVKHSHKTTKNLFEISHQFCGLVQSQMHHELSKHRCLDILFLKGKASKVKQLYNMLQKEKHIEDLEVMIL